MLFDGLFLGFFKKAFGASLVVSLGGGGNKTKQKQKKRCSDVLTPGQQLVFIPVF